MSIFENLIKIPSYSLFCIFSLILFSNSSKAEEINITNYQKPIDIKSFELEHNTQEKNIFLQEFSNNNSLPSQQKSLFSQSNSSEEEDFGEPIDDSQIFYYLLFDQLEYQVNENENIFN